MEPSTPEYMKIRAYILNFIEMSNGDHTKIPPENKLCDFFSVTRPTVRNAIKGLISEGYLIPRRGIGTFINPDKIKPDIIPTPTIAVFHLDGNNAKTSFTLSVLQAITINGMNYDLMYVPNSSNPQRIIEMLNSGYSAVFWIDPTPKALPFLKALKKQGIPLVVLSYDDFAYDTIRKPDFCKSGIFIAEQLFSHGHAKFIYVHNDPNDDSILDSKSWLNHCCKKLSALSGEKCNPEDCLVFLKDFPVYARRLRTEPRKHTAIYTVNISVPKIIHILEAENLSIPTDIALLSYEEPENRYLKGVKPEFINIIEDFKRIFYDWINLRLHNQNLTGKFTDQIQYHISSGDSLQKI